jgi:hypothetical protein
VRPEGLGKFKISPHRVSNQPQSLGYHVPPIRGRCKVKGNREGKINDKKESYKILCSKRENKK